MQAAEADAMQPCCEKPIAMDMTESPASASSREPAPATAAGDDRLSELPDCVLTNNVLSRLTSLQAVRTSVLSRRWRHLWRAVPCVDIDQREFRASEAIDVHAAADVFRSSRERIRLSLAESEAFEDLADTLLPPSPLDAPPLDAVRLRVSYMDFRSVGRRLARRGLARRPAAFHLCCDNDDDRYARSDDKFPYFPGLTLPRHLGAFASRLRTMRLAGLSLEDDFADCLAADFPVLEDLQLEGCDYGFRRLASRSLRKLSIDRCFREYKPPPPPPPPQRRPVHRGASPRLAPHCQLPPAAGHRGRWRDSGPRRGIADNAGGRARPPQVAAIREEPGALGVLGGEDAGDFPVFGNLRNLALDGCDVGVGCQVLRHFLENAPSLETLTLRDCAFSGGSSRSRKSRKRKARSGEKVSEFGDDRCSRMAAAYECNKLRSIEIELCEGNAVDELAHALTDISKEVVQPIESSVQDGKRRVRISFT
ncbi:unnamed protein product [Urochloa decumbens]|uniref:F-box domain-containing protein n=1 Tax=Urochloa decumbens TaxID=240449 RepID=A0ABC9F2D8_9POAL